MSIYIFAILSRYSLWVGCSGAKYYSGSREHVLQKLSVSNTNLKIALFQKTNGNEHFMYNKYKAEVQNLRGNGNFKSLSREIVSNKITY